MIFFLHSFEWFSLQINKVGYFSQGWSEGSFLIASTPKYKEGATSFPGMPHFTLDRYLLVLSVKQCGIKYYFLSLRYDSTWDGTPVSQTIGDHSTH